MELTAQEKQMVLEAISVKATALTSTWMAWHKDKKPAAQKQAQEIQALIFAYNDLSRKFE